MGWFRRKNKSRRGHGGAKLTRRGFIAGIAAAPIIAVVPWSKELQAVELPPPASPGSGAAIRLGGDGRGVLPVSEYTWRAVWYGNPSWHTPLVQAGVQTPEGIIELRRRFESEKVAKETGLPLLDAEWAVEQLLRNKIQIKDLG